MNPPYLIDILSVPALGSSLPFDPAHLRESSINVRNAMRAHVKATSLRRLLKLDKRE